MELNVQPYSMPEPIVFNYEELKKWLTEKTASYKTLVYTDEQIKEAKADRANLNKLKDALNDERIRREREYMIPFTSFKDRVNELITIIKDATGNIDTQIKAYEVEQKNKKREAITKVFEEVALPEYVTLDRIFNEKWLNASVSMAQIKADLEAFRDKHTADVEAIRALSDYSEEAFECYKLTLDLGKALTKANELVQIAKRAEEARIERERRAEIARIEAEKAKAVETTPAEEKADETANTRVETANEEKPLARWISFEVYVTGEQAAELKSWLDNHGIAIRKI